MTNENNWSDLALQLYSKLTGENAVIHYDFDNFKINVPDKVGTDAIHTPWLISGKISISTENK